ncbi:MAG TPA: PAS domain-containing protein [Fluviicoccus sp.]|nr:PAS domain-containing protein [Fluviicoccus sp.]
MEKRNAKPAPATSRIYSLLERQSRTGVWTLDIADNRIHLSAGAAAMHGFNSAACELEWAAWLDLFTETSRHRITGMRDALRDGAESAAAELETGDRASRRNIFHLLAEPDPENPGTLIGILFERDCCKAFEATDTDNQRQVHKAGKYWPGVMDHLKVGLWDWNIRNNHVERTGYWNELLGIQPGQDTEIQHWEDRIQPEDRERCAELVKEHFAGRSQFFENEYRILNIQGHYRWIADRGKITEWDEHGEPARMSGVILDITEQKRMQELLADRESQFQAVFNSMFQFVGLLETDGTVLECNQAVYDMTGLPYGHMHGVALWEGVWWKNDQTRAVIREAIAQAAAGELVRRQVGIIDRNGEHHCVDFSIKPVFGVNREIRWLVTEGRHLSLPVEAAAPVTAPPESGAEPVSISPVDTPGTLVLVDMNCGILSVSPAFSELTGYSEEELLGMNFVEITHPEDLGLDQGYVDGMLSGDCNFYALEKRLISKHGEVVPVDMEVTVQRRSNGSALRMLKRIRDLRPAWHEQTQRRYGPL